MAADLVFVNGSVISVDKKDTIYEAIGLTGNKISFLGTTEEAAGVIGEGTKVIDLKGRSVIPGFIESHLHSGVAGCNALTIDCRPSAVSSIEDIKEAVFEETKKIPKGKWIRGWGYNDQYLKEGRHPNKFDLDQVAPDHPVMLTRVCSHISTHNSKSLEIAGLTDVTGYNPLTFMHENGEFTGVMREEAHMYMCNASLMGIDELIPGMIKANELLLKEGITSLHDSGGYGPGQMRAFQEVVESGDFKIRLYTMVFSFVDNLDFVDDYLKIGIKTGYGNEHLKMGPIKLMIDGSSSGPTAATIHEYACEAGNHGILSFSQEVVDDYIERGHRGGWQCTSHAVGDKGVEVIVNAIERAQKLYPREGIRHRVEHCGMVNDELLTKIKELNIVPISNPIFLYEFGDGYVKNYGKEMSDRMFTCKSFFDRGIITAGASDCPITFSNPLMGIHLAVNRETQGGQIINPDERITPMQALRMFTINGAYASFEDDIKGSLELGKLADIAVLDSDFLQTAPEKIWDIKVDMTIIDGKIEYEREQ